MKVYLLFKVKDMSKKKKEFIVDAVYTTKAAAEQREARLHNKNCYSIRFDGEYGTIKTDQQQTFIINKTVKGLCEMPYAGYLSWKKYLSEQTINEK